MRIELIGLDMESLPPVVDYTTALESAESVHPDRDGNVAGGCRCRQTTSYGGSSRPHRMS